MGTRMPSVPMFRRTERVRDERGVAMVSAVLVVFVSASLTVAAIGIAQHSLTGSATDRKRDQSVAAADAGIDVALAAIQAASSRSALPCSIPTTTLASAPETSSFSVSIDYFATYPVTSTAVSCTAGAGPAAAPQAAMITSVGDTASHLYGSRSMQALVSLTPMTASGSSFTSALFSNAQLTMANAMVINGSVGGGNNGNVYANGSIACQNPSTIYGSLIAQGQLQISAKCNTLGQWWAKGAISDTGGSSVGGATSATGSISFGNGASSSGDVTGALTVTCSRVTVAGGHTCRQNQTGLAAPTVQNLPTLQYVPSAWQSAGWTVNADTNNCTTARSQFTSAIAAAGRNSVIHFTGNCSGGITSSSGLVWPSDVAYTLYHDVAVIADNGVDVRAHFDLSSGDGQTHRIFFIVPASAGLGQCGTRNTAHRIFFENETWWTSQVQFFAYSPCDVTLANRGAGAGQAYGGSLSVQNSFTLNFAPAIIPGDPATGTTTYNANLVYKREVPAP